MNINKTIIYSILVALILLSPEFTTAITASLGNSRMTLRAAPDEIVEKSILVKNVNDVPLTINVSTSGELADNIIIKEKTFRLNPGEEKKMIFTIKAEEEGKTESKINFGFNPDEGNGIGLSSVITFLSDEEYKGGNTIEPNEDEETPAEENTDEEEIPTQETNNGNFSGTNLFSKIANARFLIISSLFFLAILIVLYFFYLTKSSSSKEEKKDE